MLPHRWTLTTLCSVKHPSHKKENSIWFHIYDVLWVVKLTENRMVVAKGWSEWGVTVYVSVWENEWMLAMVTHNIEATTVHLMIKMLIHIACIFPNANKKVTTKKKQE